MPYEHVLIERHIDRDIHTGRVIVTDTYQINYLNEDNKIYHQTIDTSEYAYESMEDLKEHDSLRYANLADIHPYDVNCLAKDKFVELINVLISMYPESVKEYRRMQREQLQKRGRDKTLEMLKEKRLTSTKMDCDTLKELIRNEKGKLSSRWIK